MGGGDRLGELRQGVIDALALLRGATFPYLVFWGFALVVGGSTTPRRLLVGDQIALPLLGTSVDLVTFFWVAPCLFLVLHAQTLLQLSNLERRLRRLYTAKSADTAYEPVPFLAQGDHDDPRQRRFFIVVNWALYILLPLFLLAWLQLAFLPYQHRWISPLHSALTALDLALIWLIWPGRYRQAQRPGRGRLALRLVSGVALLGAAAGLADPWLTYRYSRITLGDTILMRREPDPEIVVQYRELAAAAGEDAELGERRAFVDDELTEPLNLAGRNLRRADLGYVKAFRLNLNGADLRGARLAGAQLQASDLRGARLQGADLSGANLEGAQLAGADLTGAKMVGVFLAGSGLEGTELKAADLESARLWGIGLERIRLPTRLSLRRADLLATTLPGLRTADIDLVGTSRDWSLAQDGRPAPPQRADCADAAARERFLKTYAAQLIHQRTADGVMKVLRETLAGVCAAPPR